MKQYIIKVTLLLWMKFVIVVTRLYIVELQYQILLLTIFSQGAYLQSGFQ